MILMNKIPDGGGSGRLKPPFKTIGGNMEQAKKLLALAKANPKISAAVVVVIVAIYFLVN